MLKKLFQALLSSNKSNEYTEEFSNHYQQHLGAIEKVAHSTDVSTHHIDIYYCKKPKTNYYTAGTSGMFEFNGTELIMYVPEISEWSMGLLKQLAKYPLMAKTELDVFHTMPLGLPIVENSRLDSLVLVPTDYEDDKFKQFHVNGVKIVFLTVVPITQSELKFSEEKETPELYKKLKSSNAIRPVNLFREPTV